VAPDTQIKCVDSITREVFGFCWVYVIWDSSQVCEIDFGIVEWSNGIWWMLGIGLDIKSGVRYFWRFSVAEVLQRLTIEDNRVINIPISLPGCEL